MGCHFLLLGDPPDPGIEPASPTFAGGFLTTEPPGKTQLGAWESGTAGFSNALQQGSEPVPASGPYLSAGDDVPLSGVLYVKCLPWRAPK